MFGSRLTPNIRSGIMSDMGRTRVRVRSRRSVYRRRRLGAVLVAAGMVFGAMGGFAQLRAPSERVRPVALHRYVVRPGDTLWSIAERVSALDADPRAMVQLIAQANHIDAASLVPGRSLRVPTA
jgi:nucleoid-associated protein YgaU